MDLLWKNKNFLFLLMGRLVANIGDSLYYIAAMWLVFELGGSTFYTGLAGFLILLPMTLQFTIGPLIDRWPIRRTLVSTQLLQCFIILIIPICYLFNYLTVEIILVVMPIAAFIQQFAYPAQSKALPLMLTKEQLVKGNSLFSFTNQGVDMLFTALGGILVTIIGTTVLYLVDSFTFAISAMLFSLVTIHQEQSQEKNIKEPHTKNTIIRYIVELKEGFSIVFHSLLAIFLFGSIICNFAIGVSTAVLPSFSNEIGGAGMYGFLLSAQSFGILIGALLSQWIGRFRIGWFSVIAFSMGAFSWILAATTPFPSLAIFLYGLAWIPIGAINVMLGSVSQSIIPTDFYGRVSSVTYSMSAIAMPVGSLLGGYVADVVNSEIVFALSGTGFLFISIVWLSYPRLRNLPAIKELTPSVFRINLPNKDNAIN